MTSFNPVNSNYPDLYAQYQQNEPTPPPPQQKVPEAEVLATINWDQRLKELKPSLCNNSRIMKPVGVALGAISLLSAKLTLGLAISFTATPFAVIGVVLTAAITTLALAKLSYHCLTRNYIDPKAVIETQKQLVETIKNNTNLTWNDVSYMLGNNNLTLSNEELYAIFFSRELQNLTYSQFTYKHNLPLKKLPQIAIDRLRALFIEQLPLMNRSLRELEYDMSVLNVDAQTVWKLIGDNEVKRDYWRLSDEKGRYDWSALPLTETQTAALRSSYLKNLTGLLEDKSRFKTLRKDATTFNCQNEFEQAAKDWFQKDSEEFIKTCSLTGLYERYDHEILTVCITPESSDFKRMLLDYLITNISNLQWHFIRWILDLIAEPIKGFLETHKNELDQLDKAYRDQSDTLIKDYESEKLNLSQNPKLLDIAKASLPIEQRHDANINNLVKEIEVLNQRIAEVEKQLKDFEQKIKNLELLRKQSKDNSLRLFNLRSEYGKNYHLIPHWEAAVKAFDQQLLQLNYNSDHHASVQNRLDLMQRMALYGSVEHFRRHLQTQVSPTGFVNAVRAVGNYGQATADLEAISNLGDISITAEISKLKKELAPLKEQRRLYDEIMSKRAIPEQQLEKVKLLKTQIQDCLNQEWNLHSEINNQHHVARAEAEGAKLADLKVQKSHLERKLKAAQASKEQELAALKNAEAHLNASIVYQQNELRKETESALDELKQAYEKQIKKSQAACLAKLKSTQVS